jgi:hypothetical protein
VYERQGDELREPAGLVLDPEDDPQVGDPVVRVVDVAVHHRRGARDAEPVGGGDDLDPHRGGELAIGEHPADLVVEDLRGGAGQGAQPASRALSRKSVIDWPLRAVPLTTSIGLNAWM